MSVSILSQSVLNPKDKIIVVSNILLEPSKVFINDVTYDLKPMQILNVKLKTEDSIRIYVKNPRNEIIQDINLDSTGITSKLSLTVLSQESKYCFFSVDVTDLYYSNKDINQTIDSLNFKKLYHFNSLIEPLNQDYFYIFPSQSNIDLLPKNITSKAVIGFYPIPCDKQDSDEVKKEIVKTFFKYNSEEQYKILLETLEKIDKTNTLDDLKKIQEGL